MQKQGKCSCGSFWVKNTFYMTGGKVGKMGQKRWRERAITHSTFLQTKIVQMLLLGRRDASGRPVESSSYCPINGRYTLSLLSLLWLLLYTCYCQEGEMRQAELWKAPATAQSTDATPCRWPGQTRLLAKPALSDNDPNHLWMVDWQSGVVGVFQICKILYLWGTSL